MNLRPGTVALLSLLAAIAVFVWLTSAALPEVVASHFAAGGAANGFMLRGTYLGVLLLLVVGVLLIVAFLPAAFAGREGTNLNIPNREYWLAPERRAGTVAFIRTHGRWFAAAMALFMGYVHWLVVRANERQPPALSTSGITAGLIVFLLALAIWLVVLFARFRRPR